MYIIYKFTSCTDVATDENGVSVPVIHCIKCRDISEAEYVWQRNISNYTGAPELIGYMTDIMYLDYEGFAPILDADLTV